MLPIDEALGQQIGMYQTLGHPAITELFVLCKGQRYADAQPWPFPGDYATPKECFRNALAAAMEVRHPDHTDTPFQYVDGFAMDMKLGMPFLHAWVALPDGRCFDPTLNHRLGDHEYYGIAFEPTDAWDECLLTGVYGLLDTGKGINLPMMLRMMPELQEYIDAPQGKAARHG